MGDMKDIAEFKEKLMKKSFPKGSITDEINLGNKMAQEFKKNAKGKI